MKPKAGRRAGRSSNINSNITELTLEQSLALMAKNYAPKTPLIFNSAALQDCNLMQEKRQVKIVESKSRINVNIAREDFPDIYAGFTIDYYPSAPQAAWAQLLVDITKRLGVEFISCIIDRKDGGFVNRTLSLREGGELATYYTII